MSNSHSVNSYNFPLGFLLDGYIFNQSASADYMLDTTDLYIYLHNNGRSLILTSKPERQVTIYTTSVSPVMLLIIGVIVLNAIIALVMVIPFILKGNKK